MENLCTLTEQFKGSLEMSKVEEYWDKISKTHGDTRTWNELNRQQQDAVTQSVNILLAVLNRII